MYNKVLTNEDREALLETMRAMQQYWPEMYARKIPQSMVQFAFAYQTVLDLDYNRDPGDESTASVLSAGSHEDIATECLKMDDFPVVGIDPVHNCDLRTFKNRCTRKFQFVVSASVIEHTTNDEEFLDDACSLLYPGGYGVFTMDFKNDWTPGQRLPTTSNRFYTAKDLTERLVRVLDRHNCKLVDTPDYSAQDVFNWEGINYSFATFVFKKGFPSGYSD